MGMWRVDGLDESTATVDSIVQGIKQTRPHVVYEKPLSSDPACLSPLDASQTLRAQNITHGGMVYCRVDPATAADHTVGEAKEAEVSADEPTTDQPNNMRRIIDKDGSIKLVPSNEVRAPGEDKGFRKGMLPLRDMKMQWTCE